MTSAPTTAVNPMLPTSLVNAQGEHFCWMRGLEGWAVAPASWGADAGGWLWHQKKRCIYSGGCKEPSGLRKPLLQVWAIGEENDHSAPLVCELSSVIGHPVNVWYFLCEWPALAQLVAEYAPMLSCVCSYRRRTAAEVREDRRRLRAEAQGTTPTPAL